MDDSELSRTGQIASASDDCRRMAVIQRRLAGHMPNAAYRVRLLHSAQRFEALADGLSEREFQAP